MIARVSTPNVEPPASLCEPTFGLAALHDVVGSWWSGGPPLWLTVLGVCAAALAAVLATRWKRRADALLAEQHRRERELAKARALQEVGRATAAIAHDFNNVLTAILGYAENASERVKDGEKPQREIDEIRALARHAAALVRDLLGAARNREDSSQSVSLDDFALGLREPLEALLGSSVELIVDVRAGSAQVAMPAAQLQRVLMNLVLNAKDAMPEGGQVWIETSRGHRSPRNVAENALEYARLRVRDSGPGMSPEVRARAFEPFFSTKPDARGSGLGLATALTLVRGAGGDIVLESQPGDGATLDLLLPCLGAGPFGDPSASGAEPRGPLAAREHDATVDPSAHGRAAGAR